MKRPKSVTAFAPATVGNAGVGFDVLGFSIEAVGDRVTATRIPTPGKVTAEIFSESTQVNDELGKEIAQEIANLPLDPEKNTATAGLLALCRDLNLDFGFAVSIRKGIPIGSGMGGSAASAVAAAVAANALLPRPLSLEKLLKYALIGEAVASGSMHADNVAPCLFGGLTLALDSPDHWDAPPLIRKIPVPSQILCVLVHPSMRLDTRAARAVLKPDLPLKTHVQQSANLAAFLTGCFTNDLTLLAQSLSDVVIEPQRAKLIPGFAAVKEAALKNGALGCTISGAGPSVFAWVPSRQIAEDARSAMVQAFLDAGLPSVEAWISPISQKGAYVL